MRCLPNWAGGKRRVFLPHNTNAMIGIVAHLFQCFAWPRVSVCLVSSLTSFLSHLYFLYDGMAWQGPRAFLSFMNIIDLRQTTVRQIEPLLEEEARHWRDELHWDYRGALELIKRFLDAHALAGCVAFENGVAAGYSFYVLEEQKGLIGGLYVSSKFPQDSIGRRLLEEMLFSMRAIPYLARIEAQLMPFSGPVDTPLLGQGFHLYTRQFMLLDLHKSHSANAEASCMRLNRW